MHRLACRHAAAVPDGATIVTHLNPGAIRRTYARRRPVTGLLVVSVFVTGLLGVQRPAEAVDISPAEVKAALERGIGYLKRQQLPDGTWEDRVGFPGAMTSLCTLALLQAGVDVKDPSIQRALGKMRDPRNKPEMTYSAALQTMVFCMAEPQKDIQLIRRNAQWLESVQIKHGPMAGAWGYPKSQGDNSNAQFALLALYEAERAGVEMKQQTWTLAYDYWKNTQNADGSWGYQPQGNGTGSMTCAGITSMVIAAGRLFEGDAAIENGRVECCRTQEDNNSVERALHWMGRNFNVKLNPGGSEGYLYYYLYGLERAGRLTSRRFFVKPDGTRHDWYREGTEQLVRGVARPDMLSGYWQGQGHAEEEPLIATSLALLFLAKGRRPVVIAKLNHDSMGDWNHHRNDVNNLIQFTEKKWKMDLAWQVVETRRATANDYLQSPIVFFNGRDAPRFSDEEVAELRRFVENGGYIFAENCCGQGSAFDEGFRKLMARVFPEPEYQLAPLPPSHAVWGAFEPVDPTVFAMEGIDYACRTSVFYSPENLGCFWELAHPYRPRKHPQDIEQRMQTALNLGVNVLQYCTNRELRFKYEIPEQVVAKTTPDPVERAKIYVAKIRHAGGWNLAPAALPNLLRAANQKAGLRTAIEPTDKREISPASDELYDYHLVFMHGRSNFQFTPKDREHLKTYLERGGMVLADAICGSREFDAAFRREIQATYPEASLERIPVDHPLFSERYGGYNLRLVERRSVDLGSGPGRASVREVEPELWGLKIDDRYAVIYSPYDLSCALESQGAVQCLGHTRESAEKIGLNVVLYSLEE